MPIDPALLERADRLQAASREQNRLIREGHLGRRGQKSDAYLATLDEWRDAYRAFHEPLTDLPARILRGGPSAVEQGIVYLESAPRCHGSGYLAERVLHRLSRASLSNEQSTRCRAIVVQSLTHRQARGWNDMGALAGAVWTPTLARELSARAATDPGMLNDVRLLVCRVAAWLESNGATLPMDGLTDEARGEPRWPSPWGGRWRALWRGTRRGRSE
ncbi:hypothetical protein [Microbacterium terricola]|uniref:DUF222 domain-containing protein n=1 Tax=Microbacterium terricola TaxID=344163 RepID=A0ABM8DUR8_9MICO|nr:hypothetical protein [Microbacterium terricola]UYK39867.1 hypothetical protein OAU46_14400 [Microbacterium terricola]BDV29378.1 hypothetical protein Microterr_00380 [Microbacterium terricola]